MIAAVDDDVAAVLEGPAEDRDPCELDLRDPAELELLQRDDHGEDVELAPMVRHEHVGPRWIERDEAPGGDPHAVEDEVHPRPELADAVGNVLVEQGDRDGDQRDHRGVDRDQDQLQGGKEGQRRAPYLTAARLTP